MPATASPPIDIRPDHWIIVRSILQKHVPQYEVWAFGSRAKRTAKKYSDLDLAIITDQPLSLSISAALSDDFSESDLPWKVDIVDWATTSESFREIIERDKVVVQKAKKEQSMAGEWIEYRLGEITTWLSGGTPSKSNPAYWDGEIPWISASSMNGTRYSDSALRITELGLRNGSRLAQKNAILLLVRGSTLHQRVPAGITLRPVAFNQDVKAILINDDRINPWFLLYWFLGHEKKLLGMVDFTGIGAGRFDTTQLQNLLIRVPPKRERAAITNALKTLDDKIELNRRMNKTLEAIAQAIFKSWFIDFDPVRAKANGEPPESICRRLRLPPDLLALFPDRLVDSELGEIPVGWEVESLEQLTCYLSRGLSPKYVEEGGILVLNQKCVRGGHVDTSKGRRHDPAQRKVEGRILGIGDILVNSTGIGTLGRVAQVLAIDEPTIADSHITVVRSAPEKVSWNYLGITMLERQSEIEALGEGSTGQTELSRVRLSALRILLPPKLLRDHFDAFVTSLRQHAMSNNVQSVTLTQIRDALLPKLLSGELRVPDAEKSMIATA